MKKQWVALFMMVITLNAFGQDKKVGGPCEGCEAIHESPVPFDIKTHARSEERRGS